jgi:hypothetical protein
MNGLMTPKVVSFNRAEFEQDLYARSSGLGYEGPLVKKMQKPEKDDLLMEVEGEDLENLLIQPQNKSSVVEVDFFKGRSNNNIFLETSKE